MSDGAPFCFDTERRMVALTGYTASNLCEILDQLERVSGSSIFYGMHHLITRHVKDYLRAILALDHPDEDVAYLN
jgi:hypothetical protein